jgi:hypothetical protein
MGTSTILLKEVTNMVKKIYIYFPNKPLLSKIILLITLIIHLFCILLTLKFSDWGTEYNPNTGFGLLFSFGFFLFWIAIIPHAPLTGITIYKDFFILPLNLIRIVLKQKPRIKMNDIKFIDFEIHTRSKTKTIIFYTKNNEYRLEPYDFKYQDYDKIISIFKTRKIKINIHKFND